MTIYGPHKASLKAVMDGFARGIRAYSEAEKEKTREYVFSILAYEGKGFGVSPLARGACGL